MDKRYQVFVSSTYTDLKDERDHVFRVLMQMGYLPAGMEYFPAMDEEQFTYIKRVIDDSDYYVLIIGGKYGSLAPEGISYTEKEYDYAISMGLKVLAFIHRKPEEIVLAKSEMDHELRSKLAAYREKVSRGRLVSFWTSAEELPKLVAVSLKTTERIHPAVGWVRANQMLSLEALSSVGLQAKYGLFRIAVESRIWSIGSGLAEPTGSIHFEQISVQSRVGKIRILYPAPITGPQISVSGSGGLEKATSSFFVNDDGRGEVMIEIPTGGRSGDTISLSGVRVDVRGWMSGSISADISMEGNAIGPNEGHVLVVKNVAHGMRTPKVTSPIVLDRNKTSIASGELTIRENFPGAFIGRDKMTPDMTNGTEFQLVISKIPPAMDLQIEESSLVKVGAFSINEGIAIIRLILMQTVSTIPLIYHIVIKDPPKSPVTITGSFSLAPFPSPGEPLKVPCYDSSPKYVSNSVMLAQLT